MFLHFNEIVNTGDIGYDRFEENLYIYTMMKLQTTILVCCPLPGVKEG